MLGALRLAPARLFGPQGPRSAPCGLDTHSRMAPRPPRRPISISQLVQRRNSCSDPSRRSGCARAASGAIHPSIHRARALSTGRSRSSQMLRAVRACGGKLASRLPWGG
eukprot:4226034-Prymnesium_polylepis.1